MNTIIFVSIVKIYVRQSNSCAELFIKPERTVGCAGTSEQSKSGVKKQGAVGFLIHFVV